MMTVGALGSDSREIFRVRSVRISISNCWPIRRLMNGANVVVNRPAAEAGLSLLHAGGDFADGVIAYEGSWLGADAFVSFDKKAVKLIETHGGSARLLS